MSKFFSYIIPALFFSIQLWSCKSVDWPNFRTVKRLKTVAIFWYRYWPKMNLSVALLRQMHRLLVYFESWLEICCRHKIMEEISSWWFTWQAWYLARILEGPPTAYGKRKVSNAFQFPMQTLTQLSWMFQQHRKIALAWLWAHSFLFHVIVI